MLLKRSFIVALTVLIAGVVSYYFAQSEMIWLPLAALFVMQWSPIFSVRRAIFRFIAILFATFLVSIIIAAMQFSLDWPIIFLRMRDVTIGAILGILSNLIFLPGQADLEFRQDTLPILESYANYFVAIVALLFKEKGANEKANHEKLIVEKTLLTYAPMWVYETGFNLALQSGHRHFLIMLERINQILSSMHHIARQPIDPSFLQSMHDPLLHYVEQTNKIFGALITVLSLQKLSAGVSDLSEEIADLELSLKKILPPTLEMLDISKDYIFLASFFADLRDLRNVLIRLAEALRYEVVGEKFA